MNVTTISSAFDQAVNQLLAEQTPTIKWEDILNSDEVKNLGQNRGLRFSLIKGDTLVFPELSKATFFLSRGKIGSTAYAVLKTFVWSETLQEVLRLPAPILCRVPSLQEEQEILWQDNSFGKRLAEAEGDYLRLKLCCEAGKVLVKDELLLHQDQFKLENGQRVRIPDSPDLEHRRILRCFKFATS